MRDGRQGKEMAAMSTISAWPFLFGRGRTVDYRPILVPAFLAEKNGRSLLSIIGKDAEVTEPGHAAWRRIDSERLGPLLVVFRVIRPRERDVARPGSQPDDFLLDQFGRPLTLVAGVITQNEYTPGVASTASLLNTASAVLIPAFQEFWANDDEASLPQESKPLLFDTTGVPEASPQSGGEAGSGLDPRRVTQLDQLPPLTWEPPDRPHIQAPMAATLRIDLDPTATRRIDLSQEPWLQPQENAPRPARRRAILIAVAIAVVIIAVAAVIYAVA
jgi:hypothetical protein